MKLMLVSAAAALALAACNREPAPEAPAEDTAAMEVAPAEASAPAAAPATSGSDATAAAAGDAGADTAGAAPANEGMMSGPSEATRDAAKEKAEQTNLHPRT